MSTNENLPKRKRITSYRVNLFGFITLILLAITYFGFTFQVHESEQAAVYRMGKPLRNVTEAGLHFRLPYPFNEVKKVTKKIYLQGVGSGSKARDILTADKKTLVFDDFRLVQVPGNPIKFIQTVKSVRGSADKIDRIVGSQVRNTIGEYKLSKVIDAGREQILRTITSKSRKQLSPFGIELVMERINRLDFTPSIKQSVVGRMQAERQQEAAGIRADGEKQARLITSNADRERTVLISTAKKQALQILGKADGEAARIYAAAYENNAEFYAFYEGLNTAMLTLGPDSGTDVKLLMSGNEGLLKGLLQ